MAEVAPISTDHHLNSNDDNGDTQSSHVSWFARALRKIAFVLSLSSLTLLIAILVILLVFPFSHKWGAKEVTIVFVGWMSAIMVVSLINVLAEVPSLLKTVADLIFTYAIISCLIGFMGEFPHYQWCYDWGMATPVHPKCVQWRLALAILMGISSGFAIILGVIFVLLLLHRIYVVFTSKNWGTTTIRQPQGGISWTISFKFTRNDNESVIQEARSAPTGQGPVHI